jgi:hypothetical protein
LSSRLASHCVPKEKEKHGVVGSSFPPRDCIILSSVEENGFSQSRAWPIGFDHNGEIVVWEEDVDFWDELPLDWAVDDDFGEEALAIDSAPEIQRQEGALEFTKFHQLWQR